MDSGNFLVPASESDGIASIDIERDSMFYFNFVTFKVENRLFRVPKHELEEQSHVFRDMFLMPPEEGTGAVEGTSDDNPIHLEAINKEAFKLLLKVLYLPKAKDISASLTLEQCRSLLSLSHMWSFESIQLLVKNRIRGVLWDKIKTVDKIKLAHDYKVEEWYADAYYELATRSRPLSVEEARSLGWEFSIQMAQVREKVAGARPRRRDASAEGISREAIKEILLSGRALEHISGPEESAQLGEPSSGSERAPSPVLWGLGHSSGSRGGWGALNNF